jgi:hypothetical protein
MNWQAFGQLPHLHYEATITAREMELILPELTEFWHHLLTAIVDAYPSNDWEAIECTLWPNSGRLIAYPYRSDERFQRSEYVSVQVRLEALEEAYWVFLDVLNVDDPTSMQQYNDETDALVQHYWDCLIKAAQRDPAASLFERIRRERPLSVYACEEHPSPEEMVLLPI